jgi:hypothetical protein
MERRVSGGSLICCVAFATDVLFREEFMRERSFVSVEGFRPSLLTVAALHPLHYGMLAAWSLAVLLVGLVIPAAALVFIDLVGLVLLLRTRSLRSHLGKRASAIARKRAANRLPLEEHVQWRELEALALRTKPVNSRRFALDELLTTYLNVALALVEARDCIAAGGSHKLPATDRETGRSNTALTKLEADPAKRSKDAVARLEHQLSTTAALIYHVCACAVAEHVDAAANLWAAEVDDASHAVRLQCEATHDKWT